MTLLHATLALPLITAGGLVQEPAPASNDDPVMPQCGSADEVVLPNGIKYCELVEGGGQVYARPGDRVRVHYSGWNLDGTLFDSSRKARFPGQPTKPFDFTVGSGVIEGWSAIAQHMTPGDKWKVTLPSELAYGERGAAPDIAPNADLVFEIEMLEILDRHVEYVEWPAEPGDDVTKFESGLQMRVLAPGEGPGVDQADLGLVRFSCFNPAGGFVFGHTSQGGPLSLGSKGRMPLPFFKDLLPHFKEGARIQCNIPAKIGIGSQSRGPIPNLPSGSNEIWMFELISVMSFEKPEFTMPGDDELTTTESGLRYQIVREGTGKAPKVSNSVVAHYAGWLTTGTPFDNSYDRGAPSTFPLSGVVAGWTEGLQLMKEGGAAWFVLPPELGYGQQNKPGIPPGSTLVFYVELVGVQ